MNLHARPVAELGQAFARERSAPSEQKPGWRHLATGVLAAAFVAAGTAPAHAGGLYISEYGTPSMGTADAGSQAWGNDASAALHNPASMTRLDGHAMLAGVGAGITQVEFDPDRAAIEGDDGGNAGTVAPLSTISGVARRRRPRLQPQLGRPLPGDRRFAAGRRRHAFRRRQGHRLAVARCRRDLVVCTAEPEDPTICGRR
jgi:hypothetical protein